MPLFHLVIFTKLYKENTLETEVEPGIKVKYMLQLQVDTFSREAQSTPRAGATLRGWHRREGGACSPATSWVPTGRSRACPTITIEGLININIQSLKWSYHVNLASLNISEVLPVAANGVHFLPAVEVSAGSNETDTHPVFGQKRSCIALGCSHGNLTLR